MVRVTYSCQCGDNFPCMLVSWDKIFEAISMSLILFITFIGSALLRWLVAPLRTKTIKCQNPELQEGKHKFRKRATGLMVSRVMAFSPPASWIHAFSISKTQHHLILNDLGYILYLRGQHSSCMRLQDGTLAGPSTDHPSAVSSSVWVVVHVIGPWTPFHVPTSHCLSYIMALLVKCNFMWEPSLRIKFFLSPWLVVLARAPPAEKANPCLE